MPRNTNKSSNKETSEKQYAKVDSFSVDRVAEVTYNDKTSVLADLTINGVKIYGCKAVTYKKDGKETDFVSFPQRKGKAKDGSDTWYYVAYVPLTNEDSAKICQAIYDKLDGK